MSEKRIGQSEAIPPMVSVYDGPTPERLHEIMSGIANTRIALIGDICLDVYWRADMTKSELSRETPHFPLPIVEEWMSPGGGGNAAVNLAVLKPASLFLLGVAGMDWRGDALVREIGKRGIQTEGLLRSGSRVTNAYCKPLRKGISQVEYEDPRIDFENFAPLAKEDEAKLIAMLGHVAQSIDVLCVSDQMKYGCITPAVRMKIMDLARHGLMVVVDSRDRIALFKGVTLKPNEVEGYRAILSQNDPATALLGEQAEVALALANQNKSDVCMTLGPKGCICVEKGIAAYIPSHAVHPPIDPCGAGDTFLAAFSCARAAGASGREAAAMANMAAEVTIRKIGTTGTAGIGEILARHGEILMGG